MSSLTPRARNAIRALEAVLVAVAIAYAFHLVTSDATSGSSIDLDRALYCIVILLGSALCLARAWLVEAERSAWICIGLMFGIWGLGEAYWAAITAQDQTPPFPGPSDAIILASYPFGFAGIALLARARVRRLRALTWLDGAVAALTVTALSTALLLPPVVEALEWTFLENAVTLAYPLIDTLLLGFLFGVMVLVGPRADLSWTLIFASLALQPVADGFYSYQEAIGTYVEGGLVDFAFAFSGVLVGFAAWQPGTRYDSVATAGWRSIGTPTFFAFAATAIILAGYFADLEPIAVALAGAALILTLARLLFTYRDNQRLFETSLSDPLTGLGNRSALMLDIEEAFADQTYGDEVALVMLDLNGFKNYNDTFGHPAGDALLARLGSNLVAAARPYGRAYRIGGDEFCALIHCDRIETVRVSSLLAASLSEGGTVFDITAARGAASLGNEANDPATALQIADRRMYEDKAGSRTSARSQVHEVLMSVLRERQPDLEFHVQAVADMAVAVSRRLGIDGEELDVITRAAALHDIGKLAIPDALLSKPTPLDEAEEIFMRSHTLIGERIMREAPALAPVAELVRASHERWDGKGYPDGLAGEDIPIGSRIIFVCDAFQAMTTDRPYAAAVKPHQALVELERCAGSQFDPAVVEAFRVEIVSTPSDELIIPAQPAPA